MVVDDDPTILDALRAVLTAEGYPVVTADNGREALDVATELHPSIVLLDLRMPELDGRAVARELATRGLRPKIVLMSGLSSLEGAVREMGAAGFLAKPFDMVSLLDIVESLSSI